MIQKERVLLLNSVTAAKGSFLLLWLQASVRSGCNHALEYAIGKANEKKKPVVACFALTPDYPEANERHYAFLLEGLADAGKALRERGIPFVVRKGTPPAVIADLAGDACIVVTDRGYLRHQREWRAEVAASVGCPVVQVESDVVVPVEAASGKEEYAAATLRPKIHRLLPEFLEPLGEQRVHHPLPDPGWETLPWEDPDRILAGLDIDRAVPWVTGFRGGTAEARRRLQEFIRSGLDRFATDRNNPAKHALSGLSPYLHFGQVSPLEIALAVAGSGSPSTGAYLEELIVRRELSMNFVFYNPRYDNIDALPLWAKKTLKDHARDPREYTYTPEEFEKGKTHDPAWNAAQAEMVRTGKMHGYLRMYWGKKILEWSETPEEAYRTAVSLNNKYELDGRDPNGYAGVAWCFGKHDRPWGERPVFGKVRYMGAPGLMRKFDVNRYITQAGMLAP
ncbi:MAG: deoxyribodipyrimidine photo-lyase [Methanomicrobiales archaeon]|nr:deoxyribodipyrimidine photo-lyase [Methanomicrobiales archaeon]MDD1669409.1 deoxyribodipyrimidine photo-lyase [Methanomicrobiales archaeon]